MNADEVNNAREEVLKELLLRKQQSKKDWNKNIFSVRTNDDLAVKINNHFTKKNTSFNSFFNTLLNKFFN